MILNYSKLLKMLALKASVVNSSYSALALFITELRNQYSIKKKREK